ncbi:MAG TPA: hypothetical protein VFA65_21615 [Bryobacteraceae bacterium]|nr:hypothetical protein [Bryobacteraceae bacterium]
MEPSVEVYQPSRLYARAGWIAVAGTVVCILCGLRAPLAFIPGGLCIATAGVLFWLSVRPVIRVGENQFNIGERAIAWREVREINSSRFVSPLVLWLKLTNSRRKVLIYPGEPERIAHLIAQLRKNSQLATFDGVAYRDFWTWASLTGLPGDAPVLDQPVRMLTQDEEDEIERMYQTLKTDGRLDTHADSSTTSHED